MWILYAFLSALFAGLTSILAKIGIQNTDSHLATALRTIVVLLFAWLMVFVVGSQGQLAGIDMYSLLYLLLSGIATGASWLCYFRALQLGDVNKVVPIDKTSTVMTMVFAFLLLGETITLWKFIGMLLILLGTFLMIQKQPSVKEPKCKVYLLYAVLSAVFASITAILGKVGIQNVESNLGTAIRTGVVLVMAWGIVFATGKHKKISQIDKKSWLFIALSGLATGASWLFYYRALQLGEASIVVPIDKLSVLITVAFSTLVLKETFSKKAAGGLLLLTVGTLLLLVSRSSFG